MSIANHLHTIRKDICKIYNSGNWVNIHRIFDNIGSNCQKSKIQYIEEHNRSINDTLISHIIYQPLGHKGEVLHKEHSPNLWQSDRGGDLSKSVVAICKIAEYISCFGNYKGYKSQMKEASEIGLSAATAERWLPYAIRGIVWQRAPLFG